MEKVKKKKNKDWIPDDGKCCAVENKKSPKKGAESLHMEGGHTDK
jgi:hypothetical protein